MPRPRRQKPYNPAKVHDRRALDLLRNAQVAPMEVDNPYEQGEKILVMRSTRDDLLAKLHSRHQIDEAQYHAGRAYQKDFELCERGPKAIDFTKEAVDGGVMPEPITKAQWEAGKRLAEVNKMLGQDGSSIANAFLIDMRSMDWVCNRREYFTERDRVYLGRRFRDCLDELAKYYGFATACG